MESQCRVFWIFCNVVYSFDLLDIIGFVLSADAAAKPVAANFVHQQRRRLLSYVIVNLSLSIITL